MIEDKVWSEDPAKYIIGADEVGRGSFAGPICAAAVKINYSHLALLTNVKDSKKLSAKKREEIFSMVEENNIEYSLMNHQILLLINLESRTLMKKF